MDDQLSDPNARTRARDDAWSPSDGHSARRILIAKARAELAAGRQRFAERQRELDERRAHEAETE